MKKLIPLASLLLLIILAGCGQKMVKSDENLNLVVANNNITIETNYKTYENARLKYSLKYSADWQLVETDDNLTVSLYPPLEESAISYLTITGENKTIEEIAKTYQSDSADSWKQESIILANINGAQFISDNNADVREIYLPTDKNTDVVYYHLSTHKYNLLTVQNILNSFQEISK